MSKETSFEEIEELFIKIKKLKESKERCRLYFDTPEDLLAFSRTIAEEMFKKDVKTNPRVWGVGLHYSIMKWVARKYGNTVYESAMGCGLCFAKEHLGLRLCRKSCLYGTILGISRRCGFDAPADMLASFENPEFLKLIKEADDKLEADAKRKILSELLTEDPNWEKIDSEKQSEYLKCPCGNDRFDRFVIDSENHRILFWGGIDNANVKKKYNRDLEGYIHVCTICRNHFKFQSAESGRLVKI